MSLYAVRPKTVYSLILFITFAITTIGINATLSAEGASGQAALPAPGAVDSSLQLWLKADAGVYNDAGSTLATDTQKVQEWHDQSASSNNVSGSGSERPVFTANLINFNPVVDFDGSDDSLGNTSPNLGNIGGSNAREIFIVATEQARTLIYIGSKPGVNDKAYDFSVAPSGKGTVRFAADDGSTGNITYASNKPNTEPHIHLSRNATGASVSQYVIEADGAIGTVANTNVGGMVPNIRSTDLLIGKRRLPGGGAVSYLDGMLAEIIAYDTELTGVQRRQVYSYLAIKYGITLSDDDNYLDSASTAIWSTANAAYHNDVAGIGRDDNSTLNQKQSMSGNADALVTMGLGNTISADNASNTNTFAADKTFLIWGNNDGATTFTTSFTGPSGTNVHMPRIWKVQETGDAGSVRVAIPNSTTFIDAASQYLVVSSDATFDASDTAYALTDDGTAYLYADVDLADGNYFTFASMSTVVSSASPGGVASNLQFWLKADTGTNTTTDGAGITSWEDSINSNILSNNGTDIRYTADAMNFNPAIDFGGNTSYLMDTTPSGLAGLNGNPGRVYYIAASLQDGIMLYLGRNNTTQTRRQQNINVRTNGNYRSVYTSEGASGVNGSLTGSSVIDERPHLFGFTTPSGANVSGGDLLINGAVEPTTVANNGAIDLRIQRIMVGAGMQNGGGTKEYVDGYIAEVIIYDTELSAATRQQVETYLALKYGVTLNGVSYVDSAGATVWDAAANASYHNDVGGIGRDDNSTLDQKQSKSVNADALVTMGLGNTISADNASNTNTFAADKTFLIWGNNDGATTFTTSFTGPSGTNLHMPRIWKVQETGEAGSVRVAIPNGTTFTDAANRYLIVSSDTTFDATDTAYALTDDGTAYLYTDVDLANGNYFTFASTSAVTSNPAPGGVGSDLGLWMKADAGVTVVGARVHQWDDAFANGHSFVRDVTTGGPGYFDGVNNKAFNFNPFFDFNGSNTRLADYDMNGLGTTDDQTILAIVRHSGASQYFFSLRSADNLITDMSIYNVKLHSLNSSVPYEPLANDIPLNDATIMVGGRDGNAGNDGAMTGIFNGNVVETTDLFNNADNNFSPNVAKIGTNGSGFHYLGSLGEIVMFERELTDAELTQVMSYLAIKYGITLNASGNYVSSNGTIIWDSTINSDYHHDVAGIARDDNGSLNQPKSISANADALVTIDGSTLTDTSSLIWGNNDGATTFTTSYAGPSGTNVHMPRIWKVQETGNVGSVRVTIPNSTSFVNPASQYLIVSGDATFDTSDTAYALTDDGTYFYADVDLTNGQFFTFASTQVTLPSCDSGAHILDWRSSDFVAQLGAQTFSYYGYTYSLSTDATNSNGSEDIVFLNSEDPVSLFLDPANATQYFDLTIDISQSPPTGQFELLDLDSSGAIQVFFFNGATPVIPHVVAGSASVTVEFNSADSSQLVYGVNATQNTDQNTADVYWLEPIDRIVIRRTSKPVAAGGHTNPTDSKIRVSDLMRCGGVQLTKEVDTDLAAPGLQNDDLQPGDTIRYTFTITNQELITDGLTYTLDFTDVLTDVDPNGGTWSFGTFDSAVISNGTPNAFTGTDTLSIAGISIAPQQVITMSADVTLSATVYGTLNNEASVTGLGISPTGVVSSSVAINVPNTPPVSVNDTYTATEDVPLTIDVASSVLSNDTDVQNNPLTAVLDTNVSNGTLTFNADGSFNYTPNANFNGTDSFTYYANDGIVNSNTAATVTIIVTPVNDDPVAVGDSYTIAEDNVLTRSSATGVLNNDSDVDLDALTAVLDSDVSNGTLALNANGSFSYTPNLHFNGSDSFTYHINDGTVDSPTVTVNLTITPVNDAPVANIKGYTTLEDVAITVPVATGLLTNDSDVENSPLTAVLDQNVSHGTLTFSPDGSFSYTPNFNFVGADTFTYFANDGTINSDTTATVTITVQADTDGDGVPNTIDVDDDGDGITDTVEGQPTSRDSDGDLLPDYLDIDSDNDGLPDIVEAQTTLGFQLPLGSDGDGDGWDDRWDSDNGGASPPLVNFDSPADMLPDYIDPDSDNDTLPDLFENGMKAGLSHIDSDGDGLDNAFEGANLMDDNRPNDEFVAPFIDIPDADNDALNGGDVDYRDLDPIATDSDQDGVPNISDLDDDNDGILDMDEGLGLRSTSLIDRDNDGVPNYLDLDSDNNGVPDVAENEFPDANLDGIHDGWNEANPDANNNGWLDALEEAAQKPINQDRDRIPDFLDPTNMPYGLYDTTLFGLPDENLDGIHDGWGATEPDTNLNGWLDILEPSAERAALPFAVDPDQDGVATWADTDYDADGVMDSAEIGFPDANQDGIHDGWDDPNPDTNNNGVLDTLEPALGGTPFVPRNTDGDAQPDFRDIDDDNDGIPTIIEAQPLNSYRPPANADADGDGLDNHFDPDFEGGRQLPIIDTDNDSIPNFIDLDSNGNGLPDELYNDTEQRASGEDTDNDGLDDAFEHGTVDDPYLPDDGISDPATLFADLFDPNHVGGILYFPFVLAAP